MGPRIIASFENPDEVIELDSLRSELVHLGGLTVARTFHYPGWRWSTHLRPLVGGELCQTRHVGMTLAGELRLLTGSGVELDIGPGTVIDVPPGHDAIVLGDEPYVDLTWTGSRSWLPATDEGMERVLATIVFTDIVESTAIAQSLGETRWADLIATHEERVRETLGKYGGRVIKTTGDGVLAVFASAARAIRCARTLRDVALSLDLHLRVAIHAGEIDLVGSDIRGISVNEAARILSEARPDEILASSTVRDLVGSSDFDWADRGQHELRGLAGSRQLFSLLGSRTFPD
ncbi:MAG: adenylate/guanylate cyclase domain-containing protein [Acidimicrobiia bacterium]